MNIILCGMMGCGKTTLAKKMSELYGLEAVDTDGLIEREYGAISEIFKEHGEEYFRDLESLIVKRVAREYDGAVISLGGGCVLREENVASLKSTGKIFYLKVSAETLIKRLKGDTTRPLLQGDQESRIREVLKSRAGVYERAADFIVEADGATMDGLAKTIKEKVL